MKKDLLEGRQCAELPAQLADGRLDEDPSFRQVARCLPHHLHRPRKELGGLARGQELDRAQLCAAGAREPDEPLEAPQPPVERPVGPSTTAARRLGSGAGTRCRGRGRGPRCGGRSTRQEPREVEDRVVAVVQDGEGEAVPRVEDGGGLAADALGDEEERKALAVVPVAAVVPAQVEGLLAVEAGDDAWLSCWWVHRVRAWAAEEGFGGD